jgi:hypothetical protein
MTRWRTLAPLAALALVALLVWLLPIQGQVVVVAGGATTGWPRIDITPAGRGELTIAVADDQPWANVAVTVDGRYASLVPTGGSAGVWRWQATTRVPAGESYRVAFYRDCHRGCVERGTLVVGPAPATRSEGASPTKLGVVFAAPGRDWHGRQGWDVELLYCREDDARRFGLHGVAEAVERAGGQGLRTLVRVAYDQGQSLPPADDQVALAQFLDCVDRAARDDRLRDAYGFVIGSGFNGAGENRLGRPTTPRWYARVFAGHGVAPQRSDNALQRIRSANPRARVLVGPVAPWVADQGGDGPGTAPWLDYMTALVGALDETTREKAAAGIALAPDGFALQAPGRVDAAEVVRDPAAEPLTDLPRPEWGGAQAGFRVYRDWQAIVNRYPTTTGLPLYVTSTNTFVGGAPPAQSYPAGWLRSALAAANADPQVQALVWFLDAPTDDGAWDFFSLLRRPGHLADAAADFDALLRGS